jgi:uncharacterized protein
MTTADVWNLLSGSNFLGTPSVDAWLFSGLVVASALTNYFSIVAGTAGGLMLLVIMAAIGSPPVFPPAVLIPVHTLIQLGSGTGRAFAMWEHVLKGTLLPFTLGCVGGAVLGSQLIVQLPVGILLGVLGIFILIITWLPKIGQFGPERGRFAVLGFFVTVLGVFVSATGTLVGSFVASASPDRRNHVSTMAALMAITHTAKMAAFFWVGFTLGPYLPLVIAMIAGGSAGNFFGERTLHRMKEEWFRLSFKVVMTLLAVRLLWNAGRELGWV